MSATIAEIAIPARDFVAHETLTAVDGLVLEAERIVADTAGRTMPFVWMSGNDVSREEVETCFENDSTVTDFESLSHLNGEWLYHIAWRGNLAMLGDCLLDSGGTILSAVGTGSAWRLRFVFPHREALSTTYERCGANGVEFEVENIHRLAEGRKGRFGLTDEQRNLLILAYERGYFDVPRQTNAQDLGDELGVNHQSVSEMLRRAHRNLLANTLMSSHGTDESPPEAPAMVQS